jgi:hypothetical protein
MLLTTEFVKRSARSIPSESVLAVVIGCCAFFSGQAAEIGDFNFAYGFSAGSQARTAAPSPNIMAGTASFGLYALPTLVVAGSTQTFTSAHTPGYGRTWHYGITKFELNRDWLLSKKTDFQLDYTISLPTNGAGTPGVEHYSHQFLAMIDYQHSSQNYFEVDVGDFMGGRDAAPGYRHTPLLSLIAQHNLARDGRSRSSFDFEVDASPSVERIPASATLTAGAEHSFKSGLGVTALALVGLTANDPVIGFTLRLRFKGNLAKTDTEPSNALSFSKLQRLERTRFGKIGRF